jgi:predicted metal-dependent HD superfamily phosphohydrolase
MTTLDNWRTMWRQLGASIVSDALFHGLVENYSEPHRKYHTMQHLEECFAHLTRVRALAERPLEVEFAIWFHDLLYDTHRQDNEERSAEWARQCAIASGLADDQASRIYELVIATTHNAIPVGRDAAVLVDIDLAILGAEVERFDEYEIQVRKEYSWVPEPLYRTGRRKILQQFASRESIYNTEYFRAELEARARSNIARSLARL